MRLPRLLVAGLLLLASVFLPRAGVRTALRFAVVVFAPVWTLLMVVNLLIGVLAEGYSVAEELPILLLNAIPPIAMAASLRGR